MKFLLILPARLIFYIYPDMKKQRVQFLIIISSFFLIAYFLQGLFVLDPDFGWHVRIGEIIAKNGIPYTDPLSYTMPSYPFVSHEWLVDLITYHIYPTVGLFGLAFVYGLIALSALLLQIIRKSKKWAVLPLFLSGIVLLSFAGIRPQVISWFFFSLLLFIIFTKRFSVYKYFLPLLFALWANVHGGFAVGIVVLGIYFLCNTWEKKKIVVTDIIIFFLSVLATGVTPYGYRVWWEIWTSLSDSSLRWSIQEWMPAVFVFQPALWIFVTLAFGLYIKYRKRLSTAEQVLPIVLFLMGLSSIRHMPFLILCILPLTAKTIEFFYEDAVKFQFGASRFTKAYIGLSIIAGAFVLPELYGAYVSFHQDKITYPEKAVVFLHEHPSSGNMFSTYEWGGYLDWKLPGKK